jgi:hypothetical protein
MIIPVAMCNDIESGCQLFDTELSFRSAFQIREVEAVSKREDFAYFRTIADNGVRFIMYDSEPMCRCPAHVSWHDKAGQMWSGYLGLESYLQGYTTWHKVGSRCKPAPSQLMKQMGVL